MGIVLGYYVGSRAKGWDGGGFLVSYSKFMSAGATLTLDHYFMAHTPVLRKERNERKVQGSSYTML